MGKLFLTVIIIIIFQGCSTYAVHRYSISVDNIEYIKSAVSETPGTLVAVDEFTSVQPGMTEIMCRGVGPITTPDNEPFENYIRKALIDELRIANVYAVGGNVVLTGRLEHIDFDSMNGLWQIKMNISSNKGINFTVAENYKYKSSFYGETGCNQTAQALMPAVQNLIKSIVGNPDFKKMVLSN